MPSLINTLFILGIGQGIFLAIVLNIIRDRNKIANALLSTVLFFSAIMLCGRLLIHLSQEQVIHTIAEFVDTCIFIVGPLLYFYTRRLLIHEPFSIKKVYPHLILAVIHLLYATIKAVTSIEVLKKWYQDGLLEIGYVTVEFLGIVSLFYYSFKIFSLNKKHKEINKNLLSFDQGVNLYFKIFSIILMCIAFFWSLNFLGYFVPAFAKANLFINYNLVWIYITIFIYFLAFTSLNMPRIFRVPAKVVFEEQITTQESLVEEAAVQQQHEENTSPEEAQRLNHEEINLLKTGLEKLMKEDQLYLKLDLNLSTLADLLNTTTNNLSWLLNKSYGKTFYTFVNEYRIKEFISLVKNKEHLKKTLLALSLDAGFNSKSTFNKVFKEQLGCTPSQYIKKLK